MPNPTTYVTDTRQLFERTVVDQVHDSIPLIHKLRRENKVVTQGGRQIVIPARSLVSTKNGNVAYTDAITVATEDKRTQLIFDWKYTYGAIQYNWRDDVVNNGPEKILDTVAEEVKSAQMGLVDKVSASIFSTSELTTGDAPHGLLQAIATDDTLGTYGGIVRAAGASSWFQGNVDTAASSAGLSALRTAIHTCMQFRGSRAKMLVITTQAIYEKIEAEIEAKQTIIQKGPLAEAGFTSMEYQNVEIVIDYNCPSGYLFVLDLATWDYRINAKYNYKLGEFYPQHAISGNAVKWNALILVAHNLVCNKPVNNYVFTNMS